MERATSHGLSRTCKPETWYKDENAFYGKESPIIQRTSSNGSNTQSLWSGSYWNCPEWGGTFIRPTCNISTLYKESQSTSCSITATSYGIIATTQEHI